MKTKLQFFCILLALFAGIYQSAAQIPVFLITTNSAGIELATSGTNYLTAMLSGTNVCVQLFSTNGTVIGSLTNVGSGTSFPLAAYGGGKYLVYWDDNFIDSGGVYGQIISAGGNVIGSPFSIGMPGTPSGGLGAPRALASDGTNFLAVFSDGNDFYGQVVTAAGTTNSAFLISNQPQNGNAAAAIFGKTSYLVVWQSNNNDTGLDNKTYGEFVTSSGSAGSPFQINQTDSTDQDPLAIAFDGTNYLVAWMWDVGTGSGAVTNWDIYGRLVSQAGAFPGSELHLVTDPGSQYFPSLTFDGANYLLAWGDNPGGAALSSTTNYVRFQFLNLSGNAIGPKFNLFMAQGTNVPAFNTALFGGNKIAAVATLGSPIVNTDGGFNGFASASVYGAFIPVSTASPTLTASNFLGTQFPLQLTGTPGINYSIQFSTNLALSNWTAVVTNSPTNGTFSFTDTSATNNNRFYRAMKQ